MECDKSGKNTKYTSYYIQQQHQLQSFTARIGECSEVHSKLQAHFSLNLQEMYDLGRHIANIKSAIKAKQAPLKVAQTRLELRSHRPNGEATKDTPQLRWSDKNVKPL